jgi:hypothetical protein
MKCVHVTLKAMACGEGYSRALVKECCIEIRLSKGQPKSLGRCGADVEIPVSIDDKYVSKIHCKIRYEGEDETGSPRLLLQDQSTNGTCVNEECFTENQEARIVEGTTLVCFFFVSPQIGFVDISKSVVLLLWHGVCHICTAVSTTSSSVWPATSTHTCTH